MSLSRLHTNVPRANEDGGSLLSPNGYDDDASSVHSRSEQDTDSDDDQLQARARNSRELRARDRMVLMEDEEIEGLVTDTRKKQERSRRGSGLNVPNPLKMIQRRGSNASINSSAEDLNDVKRQTRRARRKQKKARLMESAQHGEDGELMYEMEEGGVKEGSSTGDSSEREDSDQIDRRRMGLVADARARKGRSWRRWLFIHSLIAIGFAILVLMAWKLSRNRKSLAKQDFVSNGTALFAPTTIIISLDGFRADFLQRDITPRLNAFIKEGVSPKYMLPSFPSVTFPNHYTLATGLYPESHGVVGNTFWDPELSAEFYYTDPERSLDPKWWGGEPFWVTAERQGIRTAVHMWPGSEAGILDVAPSFLDKFNGKEPLENKVSRILEFLDKPGKEDKAAMVAEMRPQVVAAYVPNVDSHGHKYGPNSTEIMETISKADTMLEQIFHGLEDRNLTDIVNVIVVSDHGMATTDTSRLIQLEDLIDTSKIEHIDGWPLYGLRPYKSEDLKPLYDQLVEKAKSNENYEVYLRDENMPERYHFSKNDRIAPLWIVPKTGWAIVTKEEFDVEKAKADGTVYHPRGLHGYDHEHPLMRAIFVARGPAFPHPANSEIEVFQNIEVYNMLCDSVGMEPRPNNGTLRLPLKPVGTHKPEDTPEVPEDPVPQTPTAAEATEESRPTLPGEASPSPGPSDQEGGEEGGHEEEEGGDKTDSKDGDTNNDQDKDTGGDEKGEDGIKGLWHWFTDTVGDVWDSITGS
ncbi:alkaline-phosphatase-like protein [Emericellopsis atlantica]|uniref:Alkaline-phosphatase-like protein n=1 Tax=Emericellopsis atlantica TaxID=2614577 RepID=A0A9P8CTU0_9HYPO|nr:alkaline-phosphatase-like protein [Emericellopsis atlantica]KAG9258555.1 alkaline-phosphatase-like protein [Emericellopsis atlantica]